MYFCCNCVIRSEKNEQFLAKGIHILNTDREKMECVCINELNGVGFPWKVDNYSASQEIPSFYGI
jgi:hypothetical protein